MDVAFTAPSVTIVVEAESLADAWDRRYDLALKATPQEWEVHPQHVSALAPALGDQDAPSTGA